MKKLIWISTIIISLFFIHVECSAQKFQPKELKADLDTLVSMIETVHPEPYHYISKSEFYRKVNKMKEGINQPLTDYQFYLRVAPLVTSLNDEHTSIGFNDNLSNKNDSCLLFPFTVNIKNERIFLTKSYCKYKNLEGARLLTINNHPSNDVLKKLRKIVPPGFDKKTKERLIGRLFFRLYPRYFFFPESYNLQVLKNGEKTEVKINRSDITENIKLSFYNTENKELKLRFLSEETAKLSAPSFALQRYMEFDSIFAQVKDREIDHLIIDVRGNTGGYKWNVDSLLSYLTTKSYKLYDTAIEKFSFKSNDYLAKRIDEGKGKKEGQYYIDTSSLVEKTKPTLKKEDKFTGKIYVLTGTRSFSAAAVFANIIQCYSIGKVIGEETGQKTVFYANGKSVKLPNTKLSCSISSAKIILPCSKKGHGVIPDYKIQSDTENIEKNKDKILNFTLELIEKNK